ncbi:MAG: hypothetical protein Kow0092_36440 [Deferrisomatales bacterium]
MEQTEILNRLSRQEWNAAYFLGLEEMFRGPSGYNVTEQVSRGVVRLAAAGYCFSQGAPRAPAEESAGPREHHRACRELGEGSFDAVGRAEEALSWLRGALPELDTEWIEGLLSVYYGVRSTPWPRSDLASPSKARG